MPIRYDVVPDLLVWRGISRHRHRCLYRRCPSDRLRLEYEYRGHYRKTGVIIPPKDEEALYIAMKNCILGRYDLSAMKRNCLNEAKKYDNKKFFPDISSRKSDYSTDYDMLKENLKIWLRGVSFLLLFILWGGNYFA